MAIRRSMGLDNHWRCRHCGVAFVVPSLLSDHITEHEKYGMKIGN